MQGNVTSPRKEINSAWAKSLWFNCTTLALSPLSRSQCALMTHERSREAEANTKALEETQKDEPVQTKIGKKTLGQKDTKRVFRLKRDSCSHPSSLVKELCMFTSLTMLVISVLIETHEKATCSVAYLRLSHSCFQKTHNFCPGKSINVHQIYQMLQPMFCVGFFRNWPLSGQ